MSMKRAVMVCVLAIALVALVVPLVGLNAKAGSSARDARISTSAATSNLSALNRSAEMSRAAAQQEIVAEPQSQSAPAEGKISADTLKALGIQRVSKDKLAGVPNKGAQRIASSLSAHVTPFPAGGRLNAPPGAGTSVPGPPLVGQPLVLNVNDALSAALITTIGGRDNQFSEVALIADWDGREDCVVDRGTKVDDFSFVEPDIDFSLTRAAISEHTRGNGHPFFNVYYYGDSVGNIYAGVDISGTGQVDVVFSANIPTLINTGNSNGLQLLNPTPGDCADDQVTVTGIAVNPVADLGDFGFCGVVGEVIYFSVLDTEGCARNSANQPIRTRILQVGLFEGSDAGGGFIQFTNARQVLRSKFANIAGISVDDDGSLYYQLVDLIQFTGGAIFKATEVCRTVPACEGSVERPATPSKPVGNGGVGLGNPRINRVITSIPDPPTLNSWINTTSAPPVGVVISGGSRHTNYGGGASTLYGNIVSMTNGGCNVLYAAVARSFVAGDVSFEQLTEGLFPAPSQFGAAGTPSMVISFADCSGLFDVCSGEAGGSVSTNVGGILPIADGFADVAQNGVTRIPGVNNFRIFVQGNGPNLAPPAGGTGVVPGTPSTLLKLDMQIDYTAYSGIAVNEQNTVFVISGGTPAGIGKNPSPMLGEILCFEDSCPADRRADFVDLRGDTLPNPPASGGNVGDGDSDRFDHIFYQSPLDQLTLTPGGLAGLAGGFLRYAWRLAPNPIGPGVTLGVTKTRQGDNDTDGPIAFEMLDPGHQVAGGDDQNAPFLGDDDN